MNLPQPLPTPQKFCSLALEFLQLNGASVARSLAMTAKAYVPPRARLRFAGGCTPTPADARSAHWRPLDEIGHHTGPGAPGGVAGHRPPWRDDYLALKFYGGSKGECWPGLRTFAKRTGIRAHRVKELLEKLESSGLVSVRKETHGDREWPVYSFRKSVTAADTVTPSSGVPRGYTFDERDRGGYT